MASKIGEAVGRVSAVGYWRAADARVAVEAWRQSGEGLAEFASRHGIHPRRLGRWARRLDREGELRFHSVRVVEPESVTERGACRPIEISLGERCSVRVLPGFAAEDLKRVLSVLGVEAPC